MRTLAIAAAAALLGFGAARVGAQIPTNVPDDCEKSVNGLLICPAYPKDFRTVITFCDRLSDAALQQIREAVGR